MDRMRAVWRHVEYNYREGGLRQVFHKIFWRVQQWLWSESSWLIYRLDVTQYRRDPALLLHREPLDFEQMMRHQYFKAQLFPEAMQARLASGAICHGFFIGDELANVGWTTRGYLELEPDLALPKKNSIGIFDCFTLPAHRSKGIYTDTLISLLGAARDQGVVDARIAVDPGNLISIKGIERAGFRPLYQFKRVRRCGRETFHKSDFALRNGEN
jgi:RimJ/RimL family protein N-acetyltransferase